MKMVLLSPKRMALVMMPLVIFCMTGCGAMSGGRETQGEPWSGELTGMIDADLKMIISQFEEEQDAFLVKGTFEGDIGRVAGGFGSGTMRGAIDGEIRDGNFNVGIQGTAAVSEGSARISGQMKGTLSNREASGTWTIDAYSSEGTYIFSGTWRARKGGVGSP